MPKPNSRQVAAPVTTSRGGDSSFFWFLMFGGLLVFTIWMLQDQDREHSDHDKKQHVTPINGENERKKEVPDDNRQNNANQKTEITGTVIFVHAREPISPDLTRLLLDAEAYALVSAGKFSMRSIDVLDPNPAVKKIIDAAKAINIVPPFMVHKETMVFAPIPANLQAVKDKYGK